MRRRSSRTGCGALCPSYGRGCYSCFGPLRSANTTALGTVYQNLGLGDPQIVRAFRGINAGSEAFRKASEFHERTT